MIWYGMKVYFYMHSTVQKTHQIPKTDLLVHALKSETLRYKIEKNCDLLDL